MTRLLLVVLLLAGLAVATAAVFAHGSEAAPAAAIQRTFVSTSGNDANPCTRADPCRNFQAALVNTLAGGEVVALDSGGYGPMTIDKSVTIAGAPGAHVAITAFTGSGVTVNVGSSDTVVLRNLYLTGLGGVSGISFDAGGSLHADSVVASGFSTAGLAASAAGGELFVSDSIFRHNHEGVLVNGAVDVEVSGSRAEGNNYGFDFSNGARGTVARSAGTDNNQIAFLFEAGAVFSVSDSVADGNETGVAAFSNGTQVTVSRSVLTNNEGGLLTDLESPVARIADSTVLGNGFGLFNDSGTLETFGDNLIRGNSTETSGTITAVGKT